MRNYLTLHLFATFFLFYGYSNAQSNEIELRFHDRLDTFDLYRFALPDIHYKIMNAGLLMNSNDASSHSNSKYSENTECRAGIFLNGYRFRNNDKVQENSNFFFAINDQYLSLTEIESGDKANMNVFSAGLKLEEDIRYYFNRNWFYGLNFNGNYSYDSWKYNNYYSNPDNRRLSLVTRLGPSIGIGRIEDVSYATQALLILKDFSRLGILKDKINDEDILDLAKVIADSDYTRVFDSRVKRTESLKRIDQVVRERNMVNTSDMIYFTSLYDMWQFNQAQRLAGKSTYFQIIPNQNYSNKDLVDDIISMTFGLETRLVHEYHKAINVFWQLDAAVLLGLNYSTTSDSNENISKTYREEVGGFIEVSYFPSTRTSMSSSLSCSLDNSNGTYNSIETKSGALKSIWTNELRYYLSPRASLRFNFECLWLSGDYNAISYFAPFTSRYYSNGLARGLTFDAGIHYNTALRFTFTLM